MALTGSRFLGTFPSDFFLFPLSSFLFAVLSPADALEVKAGEHGRDLSTKKLKVVASITVCSSEAPQRWAPSTWHCCEKRAMLKVSLPSTQVGDLLFMEEQKKCNAL